MQIRISKELEPTELLIPIEPCPAIKMEVKLRQDNVR